MTTLDAIILGIVQGLTEFFPVSSSGHLKLSQHFLGLQNLDQYMLFDLACHFGTLFAIVIVFKNQILHLLKNHTRFYQLVLATLPLIPLALIIKPFSAYYTTPGLLGPCFIVTASILFLGVFLGKEMPEKEISKTPWRDALIIGAWQTLAIFPGVSRSGTTISGARLIGWKLLDAITFSFLLAVIATLGGVTLELYKLLTKPHEIADVSPQLYLIGGFVSFVVGIVALKLLLRIATPRLFFYFGCYCLFLGIATSCYFLL